MSSRKKGTARALKLKAPEQQTSISDFLTASGTFRDGDVLLNRDGLRVGSQETSSFPVVAGSSGTSFTLEDFETVRVIGKGGGGMVQLVRHKWSGQFFAVKVIQMDIQDEVRKKIVGELKINQAAQCPFVVICHHACYDNGVISIVFEYMDGGSLEDVIRGFGTIPEPCLAAICTQVLRGLMYLHQDRHVIHRDIKPSNLLVNHKGEVKITDFGVSAILTNSRGQRSTFVGTYLYMSPERIIGDRYSYDSDIWSFGLAILECAIGRFPYLPPCGREDWLNFYELVGTIVEEPPPRAPSDQFSPEFCSFISGCIQKKPEDRMAKLELLNHPFIRKYEGQSTTLIANFLQDWSPDAM